MIPGEQPDNSMSDLISSIRIAFRRYAKYSIAPALVITALAMFVGMRLHDYYRSDMLLFIQPQRINSKLVDNTRGNEMDELLQSLVQEILSRQRLRMIIEQFKLYPELERLGLIGKEKAVNRLKAAIQPGTVQSVTGKQSVEFFRLQFTHEDPKVAFAVMNSLKNLFIEESVVQQRSEVQGTKEFFEGQLGEARKRLETTEEKVQGFIKENFGKLPEHLAQAEARLRSSQAQLENNTAKISALTERRKYLESELGMVLRSGVPVGEATGVSGTDPEASLAQLEQALSILKSRYSDRHPDVVQTKSRIEALKRRGGGGEKAGPTGPGAGGTRAARELRGNINEIDVEFRKLGEENKTLKDAITKLTRDIEVMPLKEQELMKIRRDYSNVKDKYEQLTKARDDAAMQSSLVQSQRGAQFKIVEDPSLPVEPAGPNRALFFAGGIAAGLFIFALIPLATYFTNGSYKFRSQLEHELDVEVLGIVPPMVTKTSVVRQRRLYFATVGLSILTLTCGALVIVLAM